MNLYCNEKSLKDRASVARDVIGYLMRCYMKGMRSGEKWSVIKQKGKSTLSKVQSLGILKR